MRKSFITCYTLVAMIAAASLMTAQAPAPAAAKGKGGRGGPATPAGPTPRLPDGTVDLTGVWMGGGSNSSDITKGLKPGSEVVMQPWAEALMKTGNPRTIPRAIASRSASRAERRIPGAWYKRPRTRPPRTSSSCTKAIFIAIARFS